MTTLSGVLPADAVPVAALELADGRVRSANAAAHALLAAGGGTLEGVRLDDLLTVGSRVFFQTHCGPVLAAHGRVAEVALEVRDLGGERLPVLVYAERDPGTGVTRMALVTAFERRAQDAELRRMRRRERARNDLQALTARLSAQALAGTEPTALHGQAAIGLAELLPAGLVVVVAHDGPAPRLVAAAGAEAPGPAAIEAVVAGGAALAVPIGPLRAPYGTLAVQRPPGRRPNAFETGAVEAVASVLWTAVVRHRDAQAAKHRALHDALTGLPNRELLTDRLEGALRAARRTGEAPAVLFLDLDDFKRVNDVFGHHAGDGLLREVAGRLREAVREVDTVARLGGDEFVVLCPGARTVATAEAVARRVLRALAEPFDLGPQRHWVRASIGIVLGSPRATASQLLGDADAAMYRAKAEAPGRHVVFDVAMRERVVQDLRLEEELHEGIAGGQLRTHLQPIVGLAGARPDGLEALVRWQHPSRGLLAPAAFLGVAQQCGLMDALGAEVLRQACGTLADLRRALPEAAGLHLTVNMSVSQLLAPGVVAQVAEVLEEHGLAGRPGLLRLEVTESLFADRAEATRAVLEDLRALGVAVIIDDFGTGFSSLSRLRELPIDGLKIDRSFVAALGPDGTGDAALITAILDLAAALGLEVVCEGVETEAQRARLLELGAGRAQGHLFAAALPPGEVAAWLRAA